MPTRVVNKILTCPVKMSISPREPSNEVNPSYAVLPLPSETSARAGGVATGCVTTSPCQEKEPDEEFCWSWKLAIILRDIGFDQLVGFCVEKLKVLDCNTVSVPSCNIETGV